MSVLGCASVRDKNHEATRSSSSEASFHSRPGSPWYTLVETKPQFSSEIVSRCAAGREAE